MKIESLVKLLFNGTKETDPAEIFASEYGLDNRFAKKGMYGTGIYFADNAHYCRNYEHKQGSVSQLLVCFVIVGQSIQL
jgi:hypothetical protein